MARCAFPLLLLLLLLLCSGAVRAAVSFTNDAYNIVAGQPFTLTWEGAGGPVTITLMNGPDEDLQVVMVIDSNDYGTSFTWTPPSTLSAGSYELRINDGSSEDYSARFTYPGTASGSTTAPPPSSTTSGSPATATARGGSTTTSTSTSTAPPSVTDTDAPAAPGQTEDAGLSTTAKIGIGVGSGVGALVLLGLLALFIYRRGRRAGKAEEHREASTHQQHGYNHDGEPKWGQGPEGGDAKLAMGSPASRYQQHYQQPGVAYEMSGQSHVAEIGSSEWRGHYRTPAELEGEAYHAR